MHVMNLRISLFMTVHDLLFLDFLQWIPSMALQALIGTSSHVCNVITTILL